MTFTIRSNMAERTLLESSIKSDSTSDRRCETMALLNLLQDVPLGINRDNGSHGGPPKRPSRQLTTQDLEEVLGMVFDEDEVSTLSCRSIHEPSPRDTNAHGPKYPCRRQSLNDSWPGDDEDVNGTLLMQLDRRETNSLMCTVAPQKSALSPSFLPPKLPRRSLDKSYICPLIDDDDEDEDNISGPSTVHGTERQDTVGIWSAVGPPKLPSRNSSYCSGSDDSVEDEVPRLGPPVLKRGISLPIEFLDKEHTSSDKNVECKAENKRSNPPRCPRRRRSLNETCLH